jgi:hypothetical protein
MELNLRYGISMLQEYLQSSLFVNGFKQANCKSVEKVLSMPANAL